MLQRARGMYSLQTRNTFPYGLLTKNIFPLFRKKIFFQNQNFISHLALSHSLSLSANPRPGLANSPEIAENSLPHYGQSYFFFTLILSIVLDSLSFLPEQWKATTGYLGRATALCIDWAKAQHSLTKKRLKYQTCLRHLWSLWPQPMLKWSTYIIVHLCELHWVLSSIDGGRRKPDHSAATSTACCRKGFSSKSWV